MAGRKDHLYLHTVVDSERPARMVGLFTGHALKPKDFQRLVDACVNSMKQEDAGASLTLAPLGSPSAQDLAAQRSWRGTVAGNAEAAPQDCLVPIFDMRDPARPHPALLGYLRRGRPE